VAATKKPLMLMFRTWSSMYPHMDIKRKTVAVDVKIVAGITCHHFVGACFVI
jgi:hypothetical protein